MNAATVGLASGTPSRQASAPTDGSASATSMNATPGRAYRRDADAGARPTPRPAMTASRNSSSVATTTEASGSSALGDGLRVCLPGRIRRCGRYPRQPGQVSQVDAGPAGKRMIAGQQGNARLGVEGQRVQASENDRQAQHREIDLAGVEPGVGGRDRVVPDVDGDVGPFGAERIDDRSGGFVCCPVPDGQFLSAAGEAAGMAAVGLCSLNNLAGAADQVSSVRRQRHLPGPALKQGKPELAFELPDLLAQRRLRDVQDLGGRREGPGIRDRQEVAQQADVRFHKQILWTAGETCLPVSGHDLRSGDGAICLAGAPASPCS